MQPRSLSALLLAGLLFTGCGGNDDPVTPSTPTGPGGGGGGSTTLTATTVESVSFTIDGVNRSYTSGVGDVQIIFSNSGSSGTPTSTKSYGCGFYNGATDESLIEFNWGKFEQPGFGIPSDDLFFSWFSTGEVPYGDPELEIGKAEVLMYEGPPTYAIWSSKCGAQDGESFNVTNIVEIPNSITYDRLKYRVTFNCKLYRCTGGGTRTITNGTAVVLLENSI